MFGCVSRSMVSRLKNLTTFTTRASYCHIQFHPLVVMTSFPSLILKFARMAFCGLTVIFLFPHSSSALDIYQPIEMKEHKRNYKMTLSQIGSETNGNCKYTPVNCDEISLEFKLDLFNSFYVFITKVPEKRFIIYQSLPEFEWRKVGEIALDKDSAIEVGGPIYTETDKTDCPPVKIRVNFIKIQTRYKLLILSKYEKFLNCLHQELEFVDERKIN